MAVQFDIYPGKFDAIPKGVQAQVRRSSIFGNQYVDLVAPATLTAEHVSPPSELHPTVRRVACSTSLQGTVTQNLRPFERCPPRRLGHRPRHVRDHQFGQGQNLNQALAGASKYVGVIAPRLQTVQSDIKLINPVSGASTPPRPDLLGTLVEHLGHVPRRSPPKRLSLHTLLAERGRRRSASSRPSSSRWSKRCPRVAQRLGPLLADITQEPDRTGADIERARPSWLRGCRRRGSGARSCPSRPTFRARTSGRE